MENPHPSDQINPNSVQQLGLRRIRRVHFVGIGGAGMGGIAEVLLTSGFEVQGSDRSENVMTSRLRDLGATIMLGHQSKHIQGADVVVVSSAIDAENPELLAADEARIPVVPRAEMLAELMRFRYGIAVAGTHGKTTTTSMLASVLAHGNLDPTFVIGGVLNSTGSNAKLGDGAYLVAEADESDGSFVHLSPMVSIITNIDKDHMATYGHDFNNLKQTFVQFAQRLPFYGLLVACIDCETIAEMVKHIGRPYKTYGFDAKADYQITDFVQNEMQSHFCVQGPHLSEPLKIELNMPGRHNALNATAALAVALEEGVSPIAIQKGLSEFKGVGRRFHCFMESDMKQGRTMMIDDYGHHPVELNATIEAARAAWPDKQLVLAFQPHRYSRTQDMFEDFVEVLSKVDKLFLTEVFSAGEKPVVGADGRALTGAIRARGEVNPIFVPKIEELVPLLQKHLEGNEVLIVQGAGDIGRIPKEMVQAFDSSAFAASA